MASILTKKFDLNKKISQSQEQKQPTVTTGKRKQKKTRKSLKQKNNKMRKSKYNNTKRYRKKKGGKAIVAGGYGCIFKPVLSNIDYTKCEFFDNEQTKYMSSDNKQQFIESVIQGKEYISKLIPLTAATYEYTNIKIMFNFVKDIPNFKNYFVLDETIFMSKLTNEIIQTDFDNIKICNNPINVEMTMLTPLLKENNDSKPDFSELAAIHMPYCGVDLETYLSKTEKTTMNFELIKGKLFELYEKAIKPMNAKGIIHNDLKLSNLVIHEENGDVKIRMIDFVEVVKLSNIIDDPFKDDDLNGFKTLYIKFLTIMSKNSEIEKSKLENIINKQT